MNCPDCGSPVAPGAAVCAQCGFPLRKDALPRGAGGGARSTTNTVGIVIGVVVAGFVAVVFIGILAALAIPRFTQATTRAKEKEGEGLLKQAYIAENGYMAQHGSYTTDLGALREYGLVDPANVSYHLEVARADTRDLCVHALPNQGSGVAPIRIVTSGTIEHGVTCGDDGAEAGAEPSDDDGHMGFAIGVLKDVDTGVRYWQRDHGRLPKTDAELADAYPRAGEDPDYLMRLSPAPDGGFCVNIAPRRPPGSPPSFSLDAQRVVHEDGACFGREVHRFGR